MSSVPVLLKTLGFLGCGTLSSAIITGLCTPSHEGTTATRIIVSPRNAEKAAVLRAAYPNIVEVAASNQDVLEAADVVFLAVRPQVVDEIVSGLTFKTSHIVVSLVATVNLQRVSSLCKHVPTGQLARACPVPAVAQCRGVTTVHGNSIAKELFEHLGNAVVVDTETHMDTMMTLGCVMGPFYQLQLGVSKWLVAEGVDNTTAATYTASMYSMFAQDVVDKSHQGLSGTEGLVDEQTPGGLNETNIKSLRRQGFYAAHTEVMDSTLHRLRGTKKLEKDA